MLVAVPDSAALLRQCKSLDEVSAVHRDLARNGMNKRTFPGNILVQMYGRFGEIQKAKAAFEKIKWKNVFSWTMIITAFAQNGYCLDAVEAYWEMNQVGVEPDKVAFLSIMLAFGELGCLKEAVTVHHRVASSGFDLDVVLANAVVVMFGKCKSAELARSYFDSVKWKDTISWNSMLTVYVQLGLAKEAVQLYHEMLENEDQPKPDDATFVCTLGACALLGDLEQGRLVYHRAVEDGYEQTPRVGTAAVNMYGKCGSYEEARRAFDNIPKKDTICWTNMITVYVQCGRSEQAIELLRKMEHEGVKPVLATFISLIEACSHVGDLKAARLMHSRIVASNLDSDPVLRTGILHMYANFGCISDAQLVFESLRHVDDSVIWNTMLMAYAASSGYGRQVLKLYEEMVLDGVRPSDITFVGLLCACGHLGLWDRGYESFICMVDEFEVEASLEHYGCMVDLLGRSGRLSEAESLIESMPVHPGSLLWKVLLSACKMHGNTLLASKAALSASQLEPFDESTYVLLSNVFLSS